MTSALTRVHRTTYFLSQHHFGVNRLFPIRCYSSDTHNPSETLVHSAYNLSRGSISKNDPFLIQLFEGIKAQDRAALARAITLVESELPRKQALAQLLLEECQHLIHSQKDNRPPSFRIGLSGPPGAGKSTFIESFGNLLTHPTLKLTEEKVSIAGRKALPVDAEFATASHRVAVLAVDPSSPKTGGSLLGDKTRMPELTRNPNAYIRPSPSGGTLGGVSRNTKESTQLCEAAGFDVILVETMGVGQAEFAVANMVDMFCLVLPPAGGDELQGMKRGIMEMADVVIVNKCDGDLIPAARRVATEYTSALKFMRPRFDKWRPRVHMVSSKEGSGMEDLWLRMCQFRKCLIQSGEFNTQRRQQNVTHLWSQLKDNIYRQFLENPHVKNALPEVEVKVLSSQMSPGLACDYLLQLFRQK